MPFLYGSWLVGWFTATLAAAQVTGPKVRIPPEARIFIYFQPTFFPKKMKH
jgi:hypothetical protein